MGQTSTTLSNGSSAHRSVRLSTLLAGVALSAIFMFCFVVPLLLTLPSPTGGDVLKANQGAFSGSHILGTDVNGNDILSRLLFGGKTSLQVAVAVNVIGFILGSSIGAVSGYFGRLFDGIVMRLVDILIAFPSLVLAIMVAQGFGGGTTNTVFALALFSIPAFARVARAATLQIRARPYVVAAKLSGARTGVILVRHIFPNIAPQLIYFAFLGVGIVVVLEGALSFLGLGVPAPQPSWGNMIAQGQNVLLIRPAIVVYPSVFLFLTVLSCNVLGEAFRERRETS